MSRLTKIATLTAGSACFPMLTQMKTVLSSEEIEHRAEIFAQFTKNLVGFCEGKQSSCRGGWTAKEYSNVRLMLRQVPKTTAFEMYVFRIPHMCLLIVLFPKDFVLGTLRSCARLPCR
jgi:hypothetical protein